MKSRVNHRCSRQKKKKKKRLAIKVKAVNERANELRHSGVAVYFEVVHEDNKVSVVLFFFFFETSAP